MERGLAALIAADPALAPVAALAGPLPLRLSSPDFAGLAGIIVGQQVSRASAEAILRRLIALVEPLDAPTLIDRGEAVMRQAGLSRPKQAALTAAAQAVIGGRLDLAGLSRSPPDEALARLTAVPGIGPWTAEIFLLFCGGHPDIFPAGDLALKEAVRIAFQFEARPDERRLREIACRWAPWRGVAARLFWAYYRAVRGGRDAMPAPLHGKTRSR
ncbi:MAG: DNA-3-methyladenine glycosidase [Alphaproteobacteria bacterium]|nr:MAG: DNA-3-methyladenine glycosidase [Alphaproteobacteria bacterium]